jgi:hypothetical protein
VGSNDLTHAGRLGFVCVRRAGEDDGQRSHEPRKRPWGQASSGAGALAGRVIHGCHHA